MLPEFIPVCDPCLDLNKDRWGSLLIRRADRDRWCTFCLKRRALVVVKSERAA